MTEVKTIPPLTKRQRRKFWKRVEVTSSRKDCWLWQQGTRGGYGAFYLTDNEHFAAHRVSYLIKHPEMDQTLFVLHKCDTPACVNPSHLFLGTQSDNNQDKSAKGRAGFTSKLKETDVILIRAMYAVGNLSCGQLSLIFPLVSAVHIKNIVTRKVWKNVA